MSRKDINFFEKHVEKMVLVVVGIVCIWVFFTRFLFSPHYVKYDNAKFGSGEIDSYIGKQVQDLEDRLARKPEPKQAYKSQLDDYLALVNSAITGVDVSLSLPQPSSKKTSVKRAYNLPQIGPVSDVGVEHIRAVAYVPTEIVNEENAYAASGSEFNDIDLVTVEAKFDVAELYQSFNAGFAGEDVRPEWRDPCLAKPVFAMVELQRQELLEDGSWSQWQTVPRTMIDHRRKLFEIIEDVADLPEGGVKVRMLQFDDSDVQADLLQPESYRIASSKHEWFPPSLHKSFVRYRQNIEIQEKRQAREAEKVEREKERDKARKGRKTKVQKSVSSSGGEGGGRGSTSGRGTTGSRANSIRDALTGGGTRKRSRDRRSEKRPSEGVREVARTTSTNEKYDFYGDLDKILILDKTYLERMAEPLVFWAHDDSVEPEKVYHYRTRLGVFNPIAGTDQVSEQDKSLKNKVVLWSKFSPITDNVTIPARLCFFPHEIQETSKAVTVRVCKYKLGYWYSKDFIVKQGEAIGKVVASELVESEEDVTAPVPETINYSTGAVLVDLVPANDWSGGKNLRSRHYFDMLYTFDGTNIEHMPVRARYWAPELQAKFNDIKRSEKETREPLRSWSGQWKGQGRATTRRGRGEEYEEGEEATFRSR